MALCLGFFLKKNIKQIFPLEFLTWENFLYSFKKSLHITLVLYILSYLMVEFYHQSLIFFSQVYDSLVERILHLPFPLLLGEVLLLFLILFFVFICYRFKDSNSLFLSFWSRFFLLFELAFETVYDFFVEIIWAKQKTWVKSFIVAMFFVILFSNLMASFLDFFAISFPGLEKLIIAPTTDANFNIAMAIVAVGTILYLQMRHLGIRKFVYNYFPFFWKKLIVLEKVKLSKIFYYPLWFMVKLLDIVISLFVAILDMLGHVARVISLAFRLTGNMISGTILLGMLVVAMNTITKSLIGAELPLLFPLLILLQGIFVGLIQAFVFSLLTAIFIKVASDE